MMVEPGEIPAICLRFASPMMISLSLGRQVRYAIFSDRSMQRSEPTRCAKSSHLIVCAPVILYGGLGYLARDPAA